MNEKTLFEKILDRQIPAEVLYEDELSFAIKDINPQAPVHVLVIPKKPLPRLKDCTQQDHTLLGHLLGVVNVLAQQHNCSENFRVVINNGPEAGQSVFHLHLHLLAGRSLNWPPG